MRNSGQIQIQKWIETTFKILNRVQRIYMDLYSVIQTTDIYCIWEKMKNADSEHFW